MKDIEDLELKAEMDEIMRSVETIMKNVEAVLPTRSENPDPIEE
ncbi:MAG TPA: hypothetical protein VN300_08505 [Desulfobacterales bacterium]|jgi:hypothetical protein|nr:hypothetical protein [Desulfobacterales bacterium]